MTSKSTDYTLRAQDLYKNRERNKEVVLGGVTYKIVNHADNPGTANSKVIHVHTMHPSKHFLSTLSYIEVGIA
ncbi:hypothetical protein [Pectobacterium brasiliense]|uniref:hypothetical protein n=1 Tax=Pectobacterium brasiliense TaxID=180957 RepID=UPI001968F95E|nr:hypothetical protein [Pectobacterium brasiliense]MBN3265275.1 hypothetical protein [Pectobacterium brasiliense]